MNDVRIPDQKYVTLKLNDVIRFGYDILQGSGAGSWVGARVQAAVASPWVVLITSRAQEAAVTRGSVGLLPLSSPLPTIQPASATNMPHPIQPCLASP